MISSHSPGPSTAEMIGPQLLPSFCESRIPNRERFEVFLSDCVGMLASPNVSVRESIKDALGVDLPTACAPILFDQLLRWVCTRLG
jgi:hypothetical protein